MEQTPEMETQFHPDDFAPATADEKESLVIMRESVNFWADGLRRLRKNKIAMVSLFFILVIIFFAYILPSFWPYTYDQQIKYSENLSFFEYGKTELQRIEAGESVFPHICGTDKLAFELADKNLLFDIALDISKSGFLVIDKIVFVTAQDVVVFAVKFEIFLTLGFGKKIRNIIT